MRNQFLLYFLLISSTLALAQKSSYTTREVKYFPIFPGCQSFVEKLDLQKCLSVQLNQFLVDELLPIQDQLSNQGVDEAVARLQFIVSKEGKIVQIKPMIGGNEFLAAEAKLALERIADKIDKIEPAKLEDQQAVNLVFQLPIKFKFEHQSIPNQVDEFVLFSLVDQPNDLRYEICLFQNKSIKVYEIKNKQTTYLGKYLSLNEVENSLPYKTLLGDQKKNSKLLVSDGQIQGEFFEIYINNLFTAQQGNPIFIEVFKIVNGQSQLVQKFDQEKEFMQSMYARLIFR